ncbi:MAG: 50S ribosomal protein L10 [Patescibacteria group bacterium]
MNKLQKAEALKDLTKDLSEAKSATVVDYKGMTTANLQALKASVSPVGGKLTIVKNTLLKIALEKTLESSTSSASNDLTLEGQTALIVAKEDEIAPLQALAKYLKGKDLPVMKFGVLEGKLVDAQTLTTLSKLPGKQTLYSQLVGALSGHAYDLVGVLQGNLQKLVYILNARSQQNSGEVVSNA